MSSSIRLAVAACFACGVLCVLPARAEAGRVAFSGAVVVPTCAAQAEATMLAGGRIASGHSFACGGRPQAADHANASVYRLSVVRLDLASTAGSPLLQYFVGYRTSMHAADTQMVTRVYE